MSVFLQPNPNRDKTYTIQNVDRQDAQELIEQLHTHVIEEFSTVRDANTGLRTRNADDFGAGDDHPYYSYHFPGLSSLDENTASRLEKVLGDKLGTCHIPRQRGRRAAFVDLVGGEVIVGTTVIFNPNNATVNVDDPSIAQVVNDFVAVVEIVLSAKRL
jgi:hypothetical protein